MYDVVKCWCDGNGGDFSYYSVIGVVDGDGTGGFDGARGVFRYYEKSSVVKAMSRRTAWMVAVEMSRIPRYAAKGIPSGPGEESPEPIMHDLVSSEVGGEGRRS